MAKFWNKIQKIVDEVETLETLSSEKRKKERDIYIYIYYFKREMEELTTISLIYTTHPSRRTIVNFVSTS